MRRGAVGITACTDRLEESGRAAAHPHLSWPRGPSALPAEGAAQRLSAAPSGFSPPAKSFVWKGTVSSAASSFPQPLPPPLTALSSLRFSLLLGWLITGSSCQARRAVAALFLCLRPLPAQTGRFPPTSRGPQAPALWRHLVARGAAASDFSPLGQNFRSSGFWQLYSPSTDVPPPPRKLAFLWVQAVGDTAESRCPWQHPTPARASTLSLPLPVRCPR